MISKLRLFLLPISIIYGVVVYIRNKFYDLHIFKGQVFDFPIICVGNLAVGGSGKTPTTEYLIKLLDGYKIATLSRGYGRKTKGFFIADERSTVETIGDEPLQYYNKFKNVTVAVCEDRVFGVNKLIADHDVIILDDAFQHRRLQAGLNVLLFEFVRLRKLQFFLPAGDVRDLFSSRIRADIFMVTKSPINISASERLINEKKLTPNEKQLLVHSFLNYQILNSVYQSETKDLESLRGVDIYLLTGIANPQPLITYLESKGVTLHLYQYPDHHIFTIEEIKRLKKEFIAGAKQHKLIITTEKDCQRLKTNAFKNLLLNLPVYYIPIEVDLLADDKFIFDKTILDYVESYTRNR